LTRPPSGIAQTLLRGFPRALIENAGWLVAEKALRLGIGLFVGGWTARYLGPAQYGLLGYALAFVTLFGVLANAGVDRVVVRELARRPGERDAILGAAFALKLAGGALGVAGAIAAALALAPGDPRWAALVALAAFSLLAQAFDVVDLWFQSQLQARRAVIARNAAFLAFAAVKLALIAAGAPLAAFAAALLGEAWLAALALSWAYRRSGLRLGAWRLGEPGALLAESLPLLASAVMVTLYMRIDQVMLGRMAGADAVGVYAAGIALSEAWYAVPVALVASAAPLLSAARERDTAEYRRQMVALFRWLAILSVAFALPVSLLAGPLIALIFGDAYAAAAPVLAIHVWAGLFVALGMAGGQYLVNEGAGRVVLLRTAIGAAVNIALNLVWIPAHGAVGAAWATLVSYAAASLFLVQRGAPRACLGLILDALRPRTARPG
jgi:PST family polysaccharide transporter